MEDIQKVFEYNPEYTEIFNIYVNNLIMLKKYDIAEERYRMSQKT